MIRHELFDIIELTLLYLFAGYTFVLWRFGKNGSDDFYDFITDVLVGSLFPLIIIAIVIQKIIHLIWRK